MDYVRDTMDWLMGKGRRKADKDPPTSDGTPGPPYLDPAGARFPTQFVTPALLPAYVRLPHGVDQDEWLATHTISFFEHVNLLYSCLSEYCNVTDCSSMNGPHQSQYYWLDEKGKKTKTPAACYVDFVMTFVHKLITDESVFPTKYGNTFPPNFLSLVKRAWRYLFHVIAHIYAAHFVQLFSLQLHPHLHTLFVHFSVFNKEFGLVEEEETRVLDDLLDLLLSEGMGGSAGALPALTTSQSDSALHNKTRLDSSPTGDGDSSGDAWSLPPTGATTASTTFFGGGGGGAVGGSLSAAEPIASVGRVDDSKSPLANLQVNADDTFDDSLDDALFLPSASPSVPSPLARGDVDGSVISKDDDDGSKSPLFDAPQAVTDSSEDYDGSKVRSSSVIETQQQQQQQQQSFSTHRGMPSHSSGASDESGSSTNQSTNGAAPSNSGVVASARDKDDVVADDEEEDDKENWFPIGDLSVSADGAAMLVESMEVVEGEEGEEALTSATNTNECRH